MKWIIILMLAMSSLGVTVYNQQIILKMNELKEKGTQTGAIINMLSQLKSGQATSPVLKGKKPADFYDLNKDGKIDQKDVEMAMGNQRDIEKMLSFYTKTK